MPKTLESAFEKLASLSEEELPKVADMLWLFRERDAVIFIPSLLRWLLKFEEIEESQKQILSPLCSYFNMTGLEDVQPGDQLYPLLKDKKAHLTWFSSDQLKALIDAFRAIKDRARDRLLVDDLEEVVNSLEKAQK